MSLKRHPLCLRSYLFRRCVSRLSSFRSEADNSETRSRLVFPIGKKGRKRKQNSIHSIFSAVVSAFPIGLYHVISTYALSTMPRTTISIFYLVLVFIRSERLNNKCDLSLGSSRSLLRSHFYLAWNKKIGTLNTRNTTVAR